MQSIYFKNTKLSKFKPLNLKLRSGWVDIIKTSYRWVGGIGENRRLLYVSSVSSDEQRNTICTCILLSKNMVRSNPDLS